MDMPTNFGLKDYEIDYKIKYLLDCSIGLMAKGEYNSAVINSVKALEIFIKKIAQIKGFSKNRPKLNAAIEFLKKIVEFEDDSYLMHWCRCVRNQCAHERDAQFSKEEAILIFESVKYLIMKFSKKIIVTDKFYSAMSTILKKLSYEIEDFFASDIIDDDEGAITSSPPLNFIKIQLAKDKYCYIYEQHIDYKEWEHIGQLLDSYPYSEIENGNIVYIFKQELNPKQIESINENNDMFLILRETTIKHINETDKVDKKNLTNIKNFFKKIDWLILTLETSDEKIQLTVIDRKGKGVPNANILSSEIRVNFKILGKTNEKGMFITEVIKGKTRDYKAVKKGYMPSDEIR